MPADPNYRSAICGLLGQWFGIDVFSIYPAVLFATLLTGFVFIQRIMSTLGKNVR